MIPNEREVTASTRSVLVAGALFAGLSAAAAQQPAPTREIDNHAGIFFFCKGIASEAWTARACGQMGEELAALAAQHKKPIVLLKIGDTREKYPELAKAAGFDSTRAVWFLMTIDPHAQLKGQWQLAARADHLKTPPATDGQPQVVTSSMRATVDASADVAARGKAMLGALMLTLTSPLKAP